MMLDPKYKLNFIEFTLIELYGNENVTKVRNIINDILFVVYKRKKIKS